MTRLSRISMALLSVVLMAHVSWAAESVRVTAAVANLRAAPNTDSRIVTKVNKGALLEVLGRSGAWIRVATPGGGGSAYINAGLCEPVASAPAAPAAAAQPAAPEPARSTTTFAGSGGSSQEQPLQFGLHASWANKGIDFGLGARASTGIPAVHHLGALLALDYFFGTPASTNAEGIEVDTSGHSIQIGVYPTYSFDAQGVHGYVGAGLSYLRTSVNVTAAAPDAPVVEASVSGSSTSLGLVAGARFKERFFGEIRYHFGNASHLTLSAGILFDSPF